VLLEGRVAGCWQHRNSLSEREIAVCIITSKFHAAYPTYAHERAAKAAGLPPSAMLASRT
jgi:hypothetical protein